MDPVFRPNARQNKDMEHFRAKWTPVRVKKMRPNKDLEHGSDFIFCERALAPDGTERLPRIRCTRNRRDQLYGRDAIADQCAPATGLEGIAR